MEFAFYVKIFLDTRAHVLFTFTGLTYMEHPELCVIWCP